MYYGPPLYLHVAQGHIFTNAAALGGVSECHWHHAFSAQSDVAIHVRNEKKVSNRERKTQQERTENNLRAWPQAACGDHMSARVAGGYDGDSSACEGAARCCTATKYRSRAQKNMRKRAEVGGGDAGSAREKVAR